MSTLDRVKCGGNEFVNEIFMEWKAGLRGSEGGGGGKKKRSLSITWKVEGGAVLGRLPPTTKQPNYIVTNVRRSHSILMSLRHFVNEKKARQRVSFNGPIHRNESVLFRWFYSDNFKISFENKDWLKIIKIIKYVSVDKSSSINVSL